MCKAEDAPRVEAIRAVRRGCGVYVGKIAGTRLAMVDESGDTLECPCGDGEYRASRYVLVPVWPWPWARSVRWVWGNLERLIVGAVQARWGQPVTVRLDSVPRVVQRRRWGRPVTAVEVYVSVWSC